MTLEERIEAAEGPVKCAQCDGHGLVSTWSFGVKEPDECSDCGGSGFNWQYRNGALARYRGGPFIGQALRARKETDTQCATSAKPS